MKSISTRSPSRPRRQYQSKAGARPSGPEGRNEQVRFRLEVGRAEADDLRQAVEPDREARGRQVRPAELGHQLVVAPAPGHRALGAELAGLDLEGGPGVVIEPPHQARVDEVADRKRVECGLEGIEVPAAVGAQVIEDRGRPGQGLTAAGHLAVEHPQRVLVPAPQAVLAQHVTDRAQHGGERRAEPRPAGIAAERVHVGFDVSYLQPLEEGRQDEDQLGVHQRRAHPEDLGVDLGELPVAPLLGSFAPEHRADGVEPLHGVGRVQLVLDVGPHDGGRGLRAQGDHLPAAVGEGVHLLFDDVRVLADAALEELGPFHDRDPYLTEPEPLEQLLGGALDRLPELHLAGQNVLEASNQLNHEPALPLFA